MTSLHVVFLGLWLVEAFDSPDYKKYYPQINDIDPWFAENATNLTVAEGRIATLPCVVENLGRHKVAWIHKDRHILLTLHDKVITRNPRISVQHNNHRSWWLHIRDIKLEDSGFYMCQINTNPMISQTIHLEVVVPPSLDEDFTSSDQSVREGASVNLLCRASGSPMPTIKWTREGQKDIILGQNKRVRMVENELLNLTRISRLSMGAYLCIASNGVQPSVSKRIMLTVSFAPMILIPSQLLGANQGDDVTLVCNLESFPRAMSYWVLTGGIVIVPNSKYQVLNEPSDSLPAPYKVKMMLVIKDLRSQDFGTYKCVAKNSLGETEGQIVLYEKPVMGTTEFIKKEANNLEGSGPIRPVANNIKLDFPKKEHLDTPRSSPSTSVKSMTWMVAVAYSAHWIFWMLRLFITNR